MFNGQLATACRPAIGHFNTVTRCCLSSSSASMTLTHMSPRRGGRGLKPSLIPAESTAAASLQVLSVGTALSIQSHPDKALAQRLHAERPQARARTLEISAPQPSQLPTSTLGAAWGQSLRNCTVLGAFPLSHRPWFTSQHLEPKPGISCLHALFASVSVASEPSSSVHQLECRVAPVPSPRSRLLWRAGDKTGIGPLDSLHRL